MVIAKNIDNVIAFSLLFVYLAGARAQEETDGEKPRQPVVMWEFATESDSKGSGSVADLDGDGKLEIVFGTYFNDRHVYALDAGSGKLKWKFLSDRGPLDASIAIADLDDEPKLEVLAADSSSGNLFCIDQQGKEQWRIKLPNSTDSPPALADLDGDGKLEVAVGSMWMGDGKGHLSVYRTSDRQLLWQRKVPGCVQSAACLVDLDDDKTLDMVVTSWRGDRGVHAFHGKTGQPLWRFETAGTEKSMGMYHGPSVSRHDGDLYIVSATCDGDVYALGRDGKEIWHREFKGEYLFAPTTIADVNGDTVDEVLVAGRSHLYALRLSDGQVLWQHKVTSYIGRGAVVADVTGNGQLDIIFCEGTRLHVVDGAGKQLYEYDAVPEGQRDYRVRISSAPLVADFDDDGTLDVFFVVGRGNYSADKKLLKENWGRAIAIRLGGKGPGWTTFRGNLRRDGVVR